MDRPDVVPGETQARSSSDYFAVQIPYSGSHLVYIHYRTSYEATRKGATVDYCKRDIISSLDVGAYIQEYTHDFNSHTGSMDDEATQPGQTFVVHPAYPLSQALPDTAPEIVPVITVVSVNDWDDCDENLMNCPADKDISMTVEVSFVSRRDLRTATGDETVATGVDTTHLSTELASESERSLIHVKDGAVAPGAEGTSQFSVCPTGFDALVTIYDHYPFSVMRYDMPLEAGSLVQFVTTGESCCSPGDPLPYRGVKAIMIVQQDTEPLQTAELRFSVRGGDGSNKALAADCFSFNADGSADGHYHKVSYILYIHI
jgi:hypothetical protein